MHDAISQIHVREMVEDDCAVIARAFAEEGSSSKTLSLYQRYFDDSRRGARVVLLAEYDGHFAGYLTILRDSAYPPFRDDGTPEIVDFNVLEKYRRRHIGTALMDEAERRIAQRSPMAGIGRPRHHGPRQIPPIRRPGASGRRPGPAFDEAVAVERDAVAPSPSLWERVRVRAFLVGGGRLAVLLASHLGRASARPAPVVVVPQVSRELSVRSSCLRRRLAWARACRRMAGVWGCPVMYQ